MKKQFKSLRSAIIYFSLVVVLFISVIGCCIVYKAPIILDFIAGVGIGIYLNKIIRVVKIMKQERMVEKMTIMVMLAVGFTKKEIKEQKKEFNKKKVYVIK